jgi:SAM-dependent methyltransferase
MEVVNPHYDEAYFGWQRSAGILGASLDRWKFVPFISKDDKVLDFGCGGGYLLASLDCEVRYGIEVNPVARTEAEQRLTAFAGFEQIPEDLQVDAVISHHALEHVDDPLGTMRALRRLLRPGGRCVVVVPSECWWRGRRFRRDDINHHLYTWNPLLLGNLFERAGFRVLEAEPLCHCWLPKARITSRLMPQSWFDIGSRLRGLLTFSRQVRVVACNPGKSGPEEPVGRGDNHQ